MFWSQIFAQLIKRLWVPTPAPDTGWCKQLLAITLKEKITKQPNGHTKFFLRTFYNSYKNPPESRFMVTSVRSAHIVVLGNAGSVFLVNYVKKLVFFKCQERFT
jgi:hypothetical protein